MAAALILNLHHLKCWTVLLPLQQLQLHPHPALIEHRHLAAGVLHQGTGRGQPHQRTVVVSGNRHQGVGNGSLLLDDAISRVAKAPVGACAICADATANTIADAIDEIAAAYYRDHQFQPLVSRPQSLFLPMKTVT